LDPSVAWQTLSRTPVRLHHEPVPAHLQEGTFPQLLSIRSSPHDERCTPLRQYPLPQPVPLGARIAYASRA